MNRLHFEEIMQERWHPSLRVLDVVERAEAFILPLISTKFSKQVDYCPINKLFTTITSSFLTKFIIIFTAVAIRISSNLLYYDTTFISHFNTIIHTQEHAVEDWYDLNPQDSSDSHHEFQNYPPLYGYLYYLIGFLQSYLIDSPHHEISVADMPALDGNAISLEQSWNFKMHNYI